MSTIYFAYKGTITGGYIDEVLDDYSENRIKCNSVEGRDVLRALFVLFGLEGEV